MTVDLYLCQITMPQVHQTWALLPFLTISNTFSLLVGVGQFGNKFWKTKPTI